MVSGLTILSRSVSTSDVNIKHPSARTLNLVLNSVSWSMTCLISCALVLTDTYVELAGVERSSLKKVCTPFLAEPREPSPARDPMKSGDDLNSPAIEPTGGGGCAERTATTHCRKCLDEGPVQSQDGSIRLVESS